MDFRTQEEDNNNNNSSGFPKPMLPSSSSLLNGQNYKECLRNHAASHGGHILDGCGEFMATSTDSMKCAACNCHRSFHRREGEKSNLFHQSRGGRIPLLPPPPPSNLFGQQKKIQFFGNTSGGTTTESSSEEIGIPIVGSCSKKRFRTKFSGEQKARMMEFAERIGWRIQRQDEGEMEAFCAGVGVSRQVFKVWMHNNKHSGALKLIEQRHSPNV